MALGADRVKFVRIFMLQGISWGFQELLSVYVSA